MFIEAIHDPSDGVFHQGFLGDGLDVRIAHALHDGLDR